MTRTTLHALLAGVVVAGSLHLARPARGGEAPLACCREVCLKHCRTSGESSATCDATCGTCQECKPVENG